MRFLKMQATGNDFVLLEPEAGQRSSDWGSLARAMCDRHFGVGSDGILVVTPAEIAPLRMQMFNPDGSEAEMCGNGIRCVAKYAIEHGMVSPSHGIPIQTLAGIRTVWPILDTNGLVREVRVDMGAPETAPERVPVVMEGRGPILDHPLEVDGTPLAFSFVSLGNPHAIAFIDGPVADFSLERIGPMVEHHPLFPNRVNVEIVNILGPSSLSVRVWERGAGLTMACGTGACAVMVAARLRGVIGDEATLNLPGGSLRLEWDGGANSPVYMTGSVEAVFNGEWLPTHAGQTT